LNVIFKYHDALAGLGELHFDLIAALTLDACSDESLEKMRKERERGDKIIDKILMLISNFVHKLARFSRTELHHRFYHNKKRTFRNRCVPLYSHYRRRRRIYSFNGIKHTYFSHSLLLFHSRALSVSLQGMINGVKAIPKTEFRRARKRPVLHDHCE
jgi:hypothetical protein